MDWFYKSLMSVFVVAILIMFYGLVSDKKEDRLLYNKKFGEAKCSPAILSSQQTPVLDTKYKLFVCKMEG